MLLNFSEPQLGGEGQVTVVITSIQDYGEGLRKKSPGTMAGTHSMLKKYYFLSPYKNPQMTEYQFAERV